MNCRPAYRTLALVLALSPCAMAQHVVSPIAMLAPASAGSDPTVTLEAPIAIDLAALRGAAEDPSAVMRIMLADAPGFNVSFRHFTPTATDAYTALGKSTHGDTVFLAQHADVVAADILTADGFTYQIRTAPDGSTEIRRMNQAQFDPCGCEGAADANELQPVPLELRSLGRAATVRPATARGGAACNEDGSVIDLLVAYTDAAATAEGGTASMLALIDLALMETNQALANSNVASMFRLAAAVEVPKTWSTTSSASILSFMSEPSDGELDELQGLRDQYHADLVTLIVASLDVCGRAYICVAPGPTAQPELGFNVVGRACAAAPVYAFAHELGHNCGLTHERADDNCDAIGAPFAHAYVEPTDAFSTIVSTNSGVPTIPYFSNPTIEYNMEPTGIVDDADNAAALALTLPVVAKYRNLDIDGNGICDDDDIAMGATDLDANGILDAYDQDLNNNGVVDAYDISTAASLDTNANGIPDEAEPVRIYVDPLATGTGLGDSWTNARTDLQTALTIAERSAGMVQEVWVAEGLYTPAPAPQRARHFQLTSGVAIYGGFAGTETDLSQRDWRAHPTILSGDLLGDDGPDFANTDDNAASVVWASYTDNTASMDGFFIRGGNCNFNTHDCWFTPYSGGGGIRSFGGDALFRNCVIRDNSANNGGGVYVVYTGSPDFSSCDFIHNQVVGGDTSTAGGAASLSAEGGTFCDFTDCRFLGNLSTGFAAAVVLINQDSSFSNCLFSGNTVDGHRGGGLDLSGANGSNPTLTNCAFVGNYATEGGAGIYAGRGHATLANCLLWDNSYGTKPWTYEWAAFASNQGPDAATFSNCSIQSWSGYYTDSPGTNNLDPMFTDADGADDVYGTEDDNPTLMPGSPAIDSGDNDSAVAAGLTTDLAGNPRFADDPATADTGTPAADAPYVDRGAYEVQAPPPACAGDLDGDGDTDVFDFAILASNFSSTVAPGTNGDIDGSGSVDVFDFAIFAANFSCGL